MLDRLKRRWERKQLERAFKSPGVRAGLAQSAHMQARLMLQEQPNARMKAKRRAANRARNKQARQSRRENR